MEFKELVKERRSCRSFEKEAVSEGHLDAILDAGIWAPNPLNLQPWEFLIVTEGERKSEIRAVAEEAKQKVLDGEGPGWVSKYDMDFLEGAPMLIVVLYDPGKSGLGPFFGQEQGALQASSACIQNMMLAAADLGYGSLWFTWFEPQRLKDVLNIPENREIAGVIPLGRPSGESKAPPRKDPKVYRDTYGDEGP
ncbi:MAG: nitroreductase family protein [Deltaproteobacteria bacterium]|nr:nitroreductase family protein [Deltaproteobacteria bacterium]MBW2138508.1 nitroreductase family protein [Deltaproteobacteria bacterium]